MFRAQPWLESPGPLSIAPVDTFTGVAAMCGRVVVFGGNKCGQMGQQVFLHSARGGDRLAAGQNLNPVLVPQL
jgi:hypothetical protein